MSRTVARSGGRTGRSESSRAPSAAPCAERLRLKAADAGDAAWRRWGPYLGERQWGTVREDYSADGDCWSSFPHDHARSRAYRWGEDGLLGICDDDGVLNFAIALWNGRDPILKERLFGLTGPEGNHGEDVKEEYFYLDSTPTHSYMKALYKYPQAPFPYARLVEENRLRGRHEREFELGDTGVFDESRYFDVQVEYAKAAPEDILVRITVSNRGPDKATIHLLPTLWFRNTWSWDGRDDRPILRAGPDGSVLAHHRDLGPYVLTVDAPPGIGTPTLLFTENDSNAQRLWGTANASPFVKDAFHARVIHGDESAVNPQRHGTKAAAWITAEVPAGGSIVVRARLCRAVLAAKRIAIDDSMRQRLREADEYFRDEGHDGMTEQERLVARQAAAGLLWSKQFYCYDVGPWLDGDPAQPRPPESRRQGRNAAWRHLNNRDVISMPDKWEYPWYAAWDLAFQMIPMARLDPGFAKDQLLLMLREWYMHSSGQLPAYEFAFGDVNPPVHAWACWKVYTLTAERGERDRAFLARCFQKLLLNFTWWVNRKDPSGNNLFSGGFLGLDNIGCFDRSRPLPTGGHLEQADGTAWMAFYCGTMLSMALELARDDGNGRIDTAYEDMATKFFEHFIAITDSINTLGGTGLWNDADGFYYDQIRMPGMGAGDGHALPLAVRSLVGVVPILAVEVIDDDVIDCLPDFKRRMNWFLQQRHDLPWFSTCSCGHAGVGGAAGGRRLLAIPTRERLERVVGRLMDETEFLSPHGVRSVSRRHEADPFRLHIAGEEFRVEYVPGESTTGLFGGNSNWRGPVWFPLNYLLIEALERYHRFYGDSVRVPIPGVGHGTLADAAAEIRRRLVRLFLPNASGHRPCHAGLERFATDPHWRDLVYFHEHFHPETGRGLGATHQTGWTALVLSMLGPEPSQADAQAAAGTDDVPGGG